MSRRYLTVLSLVLPLAAGSPLLAQNLLPNAGFDANLSPWENGNSVYIDLERSPLDVAGDPGSGSAEVTNTAADFRGGGNGLETCVPVTPGAAYDLGGFVRIPSGQVDDGDASLAGFFWDDGSCDGSILDSFSSGAASDIFDEWVLVQDLSLVAPPAARSASIVLFNRKTVDGGSFTVLFDDPRFCPTGTCGLQLGETLQSVEVPGFRFRVTVETATDAIPGAMEPVCLDETLCVSGAKPGRVEAQIRTIGPRPNGFLWLQVVRFTPSRLVVEAEQLATGKVRYYVLESIGPGDRPVSLEDRTAFQP